MVERGVDGWVYEGERSAALVLSERRELCRYFCENEVGSIIPSTPEIKYEQASSSIMRPDQIDHAVAP